jgi:hypothetical protein
MSRALDWYICSLMLCPPTTRQRFLVDLKVPNMLLLGQLATIWYPSLIPFYRLWPFIHFPNSQTYSTNTCSMFTTRPSRSTYVSFGDNTVRNTAENIHNSPALVVKLLPYVSANVGLLLASQCPHCVLTFLASRPNQAWFHHHQ